MKRVQGLLNKKLLFIALSLVLLLPFAAVPAFAEEEHSEYERFLEEIHGITIDEAVTKGQFLRDLATILDLAPSDETVVFADLAAESEYYDSASALYEQGIITADVVQADQTLTPHTAVYIAVKSAGLKELAYTYPESKINAALAKLGLDSSAYSKQAGQELAVAVDTGLIPTEYYDEFAEQSAASPAFVETLLGQILTFNGQYQHYIGRISDDDIFLKLADAYRTADLIEAPELRDLVDTALKQNLFTGYNLKDARYDANFVPSLSITYGHDNELHAKQLIGLLLSEGIDAKVQLEPKTSAFIYMQEWGEPVETDDYKVVQIENGNYIAYAKEYDLAFEFDSTEDKARFNDIILQYAKKNSDDATGLIASSWWQPLYYSLTELDGYPVISNNKITADGHYYAQSFSLNDQSTAIVEGLLELDPNVKVESYQFWVDQPFHNYLLGDYQ